MTIQIKVDTRAAESWDLMVQFRARYSGHKIGSPCQGSEYHRARLCPRTAFLHSQSPPLSQLLEEPDLYWNSAIRGYCPPEPEKDRQYTYKRNIEAVSHKSFCHWNARSITYSERLFVALVIQYVMRMRCIVICGVSGYTVFFYIISYMARFSGWEGEAILHKLWVVIFLKFLSERFLILRRIRWDIIINVHTSLTLRRLMSCIYEAPILDVSRSHTTTQHSR